MDVWKIGVTIGLTNNMSTVLAAIGKDVLGLQGKVSDVEKALTSWNTAIIGAGTALAGAGIIEGLIKLTEHGRELVHVQEQLIAGGISQADVAAATGKAWDVAAQSGQKVADVLASMNEIRNPLGGIEEAMARASTLGDAMVVLRAMDEKGGTKVADQMYALVKSAEFRGSVNGPDFDKTIDMIVRGSVATGGKVDPAEFLQFAKYSRGALPGLSDRFLYEIGPELIQEFKGSSAGNALAGMYRQLVGGQLSTRSIRLLDQIGMVNENNVEYDNQGRIVRAKPGAIVGADMFAKDPDQFAKVFLDHLVAHGITDKGDQGGYFAMIFNRIGEQMAKTLAYQTTRLDRGAAGVAQTMDIHGAAQELLQSDPTTAANNFSAAWHNLLTALGAPLVQPAIEVMNSVAGAFKSMTAIAAAHPEAIRIVGEGLAALGVAMVALGGAAIVAAAAALLPGGLVAAAIVGIGSAIATFAAFNWQAVSAALTGVYNALANFIHNIVTLGGLLGTTPGTGIGAAGTPNAPGTPQIKVAPFGAPEHPGKESYVPMNYNPGTSQPLVIHTAVNIDGARVGQAIARVAAGYGMPSGPPTPNNRALVPTVDGSGGGGGYA